MNVPDGGHIVALCGSQRDGSYTRLALEAVLTAAETEGASIDLVDLAELELPLYDPDRADAGDAPELRRRVLEADAVVFGSPLYHGSYASPLKTAIDYCGFDEFESTTVGLLVVAGGKFPTPALEHLRMVARELDAWILPHHVAVPNVDTTFEDGQLTDDGLRERIEELGTKLVDYAGVESFPEPTAGCAVPGAE